MAWCCVAGFGLEGRSWSGRARYRAARFGKLGRDGHGKASFGADGRVAVWVRTDMG